MFGDLGLFSAPKTKCQCGNEMTFPNGWYPEYFICSNCGKKFDFIKDCAVQYPNRDLNKPLEERIKDQGDEFNKALKDLRKAKEKEELKAKFKLIDGSKGDKNEESN